jgi:hypothetical protein
MAMIRNQSPLQREHEHRLLRTGPQKVCIILGTVFIFAGLVGVLLPGFLGMHLSVAHNFIHLISGGIAFACAFTENPKVAYGYCVLFGVIYGLIGVAGFLIGQPGYPAVGFLQADQNLFRVIPNILELGTMDHIVHLILGSAALGAAIVFRRERKFRAEAPRMSRQRSYGTDIYPSDVDETKAATNLGSSDLEDDREHRV